MRTCCAKDHPKRPLQINESFINLLVKHNLYAAGNAKRESIRKIMYGVRDYSCSVSSNHKINVFY